MAQQEVAYGQISQQLHSSQTVNEGDYVPQQAVRPPEFVGFVPFQQRPPQPSLSLSLERPDTYSNVNLPQNYQSPPGGSTLDGSEVRPSDVHMLNIRPDSGSRPFDLEQQPFQHLQQQQQQQEDYEPGHGDAGAEETHQQHVHPEDGSEAQLVHTDEGSPEHMDDGMQLQIVPANEYPSQHQDGQQQRYPPALATHQAVVQDPELFLTTLDNFLAALGTSLTVPKIGNKELNLHEFYCKVTARGGLEQVIRSSLWKELCKALDMPRSSPSMSYVLRKHYTNLLFHYEQVYFFRAEGSFLTPPVPLPAPGPAKPLRDAGSPYEVLPELRSFLKKKKNELDPMQVFGVDPAGSIGTNATGAISGKFDEGYFVTVVVGTEKLTGVLYHISPRKKNQQFASVPSLLDGIGVEGNTPGLEIQIYGSKKKKERVKRNGPKRTRTGYNIFFKEQRAKLKQLYPDTKNLGKTVIEMWNKLPEEDKADYISRGNVERERYMTEYREKMKQQQQTHTADGANGLGAVAQSAVDHDQHDHGAYYHVSLDVESELQSGHLHTSADHVYHGYEVNETEQHLPESDTVAGHMVPTEQTYEGHQEEGDYAQERAPSEEGEDDNEMGEETYEGVEEDETMYPSAEKMFEEQEGNEYHVSDHEYNAAEGTYQMQPNDAQSHDPREYNGSATPKQPYYGQDHSYPYIPTLPQQRVEGMQGSGHVAMVDRAPQYSVRDNGQPMYPHMQKGRPDMPMDNATSQHHLYPHDRYAYSHSRQAQTGEMNMPVAPEQGAYRRQEDAGSTYFHQNQAVGSSNMQARQMPPDQSYPDRYGYSVPMPHAQMYARPPHPYPVRFPHPSYPMQWSSESQAFQHGHAYTPQLHQTQPVAPEVSAVRPTPQAYQVQDGRHAYKG